MISNPQRLQLLGHSGATLAARLDLPNGAVTRLRTVRLLLHLL